MQTKNTENFARVGIVLTDFGIGKIDRTTALRKLHGHIIATKASLRKAEQKERKELRRQMRLFENAKKAIKKWR